MNNDKLGMCSSCKQIKEISKVLNYHSYCSSCYSSYQSNYYDKNVKVSEYIYILWNVENEALYIGSTNNKYRLLKHVKGNTHLNLNINDWYDIGLSHCAIANVSNVISNKRERTYLEKLYIQLHNPYLNSSTLRNVTLTEDRECELNYYFNKQFIEFDNIEIDRDYLGNGNIEVNKIIFR